MLTIFQHASYLQKEQVKIIYVLQKGKYALINKYNENSFTL